MQIRIYSIQGLSAAVQGLAAHSKAASSDERLRASTAWLSGHSQLAWVVVGTLALLQAI